MIPAPARGVIICLPLFRRAGSLAFGHALTYADRPTLAREAVVNSLDWDWQDRGVRFRGQGFYSDLQQDANDINENLDRDEQDFGGWGEFNYRPDDEHQWKALAYCYGDEYNMNDLGFFRRNDWLRLVAEYQRDYTSHPESPALRSSLWRVKPAYEENNAGDRLQEAVDLTYSWKMESTRQ